MRRLILAGLMAATLAPVAAASAQSAQDLRDDRRDIRDERRDVRQAIRDGDSPREIREQRRDVREARQDYREDWRDWRDRHPDYYRGPAYAGPRGYVYRPVNVGYRFAPAYYDRRYWVDPVRYRLAPIGPNERWVRYGRDVIRIDVRTGRVVDLHSGFFY